MELRQLRYFVAIAEAGSFSAAAARLHLSQPPLSTQIRALETELGTPLLQRGNRGIQLTAAGVVFHREAARLLAQLQRARQLALQAADGEFGSLAVGFVSIADYSVLPPALHAFRQRFPAVEVELHELTTDVQIRELRAGRLDLSIALAPVDEADLQFSTLLSEALVLAAPAGHPALAPAGAIELRQLAREAFIIPPRAVGPGLYDLVISQCRACGFVPRITQHARQMQTVIGLVAAGMGFALVPSSVRMLQRPGVEYRPLAGAPAQVELGVLRRRDTDTPTLRHFVDALHDVGRSETAGAQAVS